MTHLGELAALIARHAPEDGLYATDIPRLSLARFSAPSEPFHTLCQPALCIVAQGRKQAVLADRTYIYDAAKYLVASVDLPVVGNVIEATPEQPYLSLRLDLNLPMLSEMLLERPAAIKGDAASPGIVLSDVTAGMLDACVRLLRLLDTPEDAEVLAPLAEREILYRLLMSEQGAMARHIAAGESRLTQISRAIGWIRENFTQALSIDQLSGLVGMSNSSFHQHFKAVTRMSPLQYRTQMRLQEARRLMVSEAIDAADAGFRVGYESPSQFSRDYSRVFGTPPLRDAARIRATTPDYAMVA